MDKNSWIGLGLIAAVMIGFSYFNRPSQEELERRQRYADSIALVEQQKMAEQAALEQLKETQGALEAAEMTEAEKDSVLGLQYGAFAKSALGSEQLYVVENDLLRLTFQAKGGTLYSAELKDYKSYGDTINPLCLFKGAEESELGYTLVTTDHRIMNTADLFFEMLPVQEDSLGQIVTMRLKTTKENAYLDFVYTIAKDDYMIHFDIQAHQLQGVLAANMNTIEMNWRQLIPQHEKGRRFEERYAQLQYMFTNRDIEKLSEAKNEREEESAALRWIAYKDQFFSTVIIAEDGFDGAKLESNLQNQASGYVKEYKTETALAFDVTGAKPTSMRMYLGPNKYNTLKAYDKGKQRYDELRLKELVPLGWNIVSWVNKLLVIPMFQWLSNWGLNIGLIILIITIVVKLIILPFTFKSYKSSAKMRALKPEIDEINERIPEEKMQERQMATMALYNKAGVSPMAGCLPMLLQMPVVMALFWFFPTAIELRGQSFLWADDLSTFDAIISWDANIPILSWALNNHLSLFTLLFTGTNIVYTYLNMQTQPSSGQQMKMMQWMMYLMPLMFFFMFNDYASGLSYYYFLSLLFSIAQTYIFRLTLNEEKLREEMKRAQIKKANKQQKATGFRARLEEMQREQQKRMREQIKEQSKKSYR